MAGPIKISVLADVGQAVKSVTKFSDTVDSETKRVVTSLGDSKLTGGWGKMQEGFDVLDTRAMGFRDTITGVQDTMTGFQGLLGDRKPGQTFADSLLQVGMGVGDLASGFANFIVPMLAVTSGLSAQAAAAGTSTTAFLAQKVAMAAGAVVSGVMTAAQWALNVALSANPIGLVILAIVALVGVIVLAYKKSDTFRAIVNAVGSALRTAAVAVWDFIVKVVKFVTDLQAKVQGVFRSAGSWLRDAGTRIIQGLIDGVTSKFDFVRKKFQQLTDMIPDWKGPASRDRKLLYDNGQLVIGGFLAGVEGQYGAVQKSLTGFTSGLTTSAGIGGTVSVEAPAAPAWARELLAALRGGLTLTIDRTGSPITDRLLAEVADRVRVKGGKGTVLGITA